MDKITELVGTTYPTMTYAMSAATAAVADQTAALTAEKVGIETAMNTMMLKMNKRVNELTPLLNGYVYGTGDYGINTLRTEYMIESTADYDLTDLIGGNYMFTCSNDLTATFLPASIIWCDNGADYAYRCEVSGSAIYDGGTNTTTVHISAGYINVHLESVGHVIGTSSPSSIITTDSQILKIQDDFDFAYDHIHHAMDPNTGTYGLQAKIDAISGGSTILAANKAQQDEMDSHYRDYTSWTPLTLTSLAYIDETSFKCAGNMESSFTSGADLLIDCGIDKSRGCKVQSVEFIPANEASYTEVTIVIDAVSYMNSPATSAMEVSAMKITFDEDNFLTMSVSGVDIVGSSWVDNVTFTCTGDMTSILTSASGGTSLVATFGPDPVDGITFSPRYFKVYYSEHKTNSNANSTVVTLSDGLPITSNISAVNVIGT